MNATLGYLGLGNMGQPMATRLVDAGHTVVVRDINGAATEPLMERQVKVATSGRDLADNSEIIVCSLPSNKIIREAVLGAEGLIEGDKMRVFVNACTTGSPFAEEMNEALAAKGVTYFDAPISGGPAGARDGTLSVMTSGPKEIYDEIEPYLRAYGTTLVYCGEKPGLAQVLKLANNMLFASNIMVTSEVMAMGVKAGLDAETMITAISAGSGRNSSIDMIMPRSVMPRTFDFGATIDILMKDVNLALEEGEAQGVPQPVSQQTRQLMLLAMHRGWAQKDLSELAKLVEEWSGTEIK
jgi:3-hydroxyisobutyrate dehydrogenase-like beta-hydroxyacid dehydrogenase